MRASESTRGIKVDLNNKFSIVSEVDWMDDMVKYMSIVKIKHATRAVHTKNHLLLF